MCMTEFICVCPCICYARYFDTMSTSYELHILNEIHSDEQIHTHISFVYIECFWFNLNWMNYAFHYRLFSINTYFNRIGWIKTLNKIKYWFYVIYDNVFAFTVMKHWRFNLLLLVAVLSTCLVTISANDDEDDDGVTVESEKIVIFLHYLCSFNIIDCKISIQIFCIIWLGVSKAGIRSTWYDNKLWKSSDSTG